MSNDSNRLGVYGYAVMYRLQSGGQWLVDQDDEYRTLPAHYLSLDEALDALAETSAPDGTWTHYANVNAIHIAALAQGCLSFPQHPRQPAWLAAARQAADLWLNLTASEPDAVVTLQALAADI